MRTVHADLIRDGIQGDLYYENGSGSAGKAMIVLGGSMSSYRTTRKIAERFAEMGIPSFALCYYGKTGLPLDIRRIPIEYVRDAAAWLYRNGYDTVGIYGISKGAEYALAAASALRSIRFTVAVSPFDYVLEGQTILGTSTNSSSWSLNGKELPWLPWDENFRGILAVSTMTTQLDTRFRYRDALRFANERAVIKVEKINGPILFITASDDTIWSSNEAAIRMMARLRVQHFPYHFEHINYRYGTHMMLPFEKIPLVEMLLFRNARKRTRRYAASRTHAAKKIVNFVKNV